MRLPCSSSTPPHAPIAHPAPHRPYDLWSADSNRGSLPSKIHYRLLCRGPLFARRCPLSSVATRPLITAYARIHRSPADNHPPALLPLPNRQLLFFSFFKTLVGKEVAVELKNDLAVTGTLHSVDQYLNIKLENVTVVDQARFPQLVRSRAEVACLFVYVSVCLGVWVCLVRIWADAATTPALLVRSCCEDATCRE